MAVSRWWRGPPECRMASTAASKLHTMAPAGFEIRQRRLARYDFRRRVLRRHALLRRQARGAHACWRRTSGVWHLTDVDVLANVRFAAISGRSTPISTAAIVTKCAVEARN